MAQGVSQNRTPRLGLIVNPIAGMGGAVGLKGTDGPEALARARELGARPRAAERATATLRVIAEKHTGDLDVFTGPGEMGESAARAVGFQPMVVGQAGASASTPGDTRDIAQRMAALELDLLLFAGGDGTVRDICAAIGQTALALGIPAGVKMHSAVYATSPRAAGELASQVLAGSPAPAREAEVMDIDEEAFRDGRVSAKLYGYLVTPTAPGLVQGLKSGSRGDAAELAGLAAEIEARMDDGALWIVGPGTTTRAIAERLQVPKTLLGVDLYCRGEVVERDATEQAILKHARDVPAWIVVTPIGGQGYIFGRGNQQLSAPVIRAVGKERIVVVASPAKLASLRSAPLLVDTGDPELDHELSRYIRVVSGFRSETIYRIA
jgi:predicted polyphosphate/ATP-dependent NAD kinase